MGRKKIRWEAARNVIAAGGPYRLDGRQCYCYCGILVYGDPCQACPECGSYSRFLALTIRRTIAEMGTKFLMYRHERFLRA